jgi:pyruvate/2-oxoglutarate dehydrogenase complex dihydrolipoamide dehydrogenase (E3) component
VKKHVKTPVATVGAFSDPYQLEEILASGEADIINIGRGSLADPDLPVKALLGKEDEINRCLRCYACFAHADAVKYFACSLNPAVGSEVETKFDVPPRHLKRILVAGGGIAGMQAALTASARGHEVILCEKTDRLGGVLTCEAQVSFKKNLHLYLEKQIKLISGAPIEVRLNTAVTPELAEALKPDVIIAALGARPVVPDIPGIRNRNVFSAEELYRQPERAGARVAVIGGGLVGVELAVHLSALGRRVTVLEMTDRLNYTGARLHGYVLDQKIKELGITVMTGVFVTEILKEGVAVSAENGPAQTVFADTVVYAVGLKPERDAAQALRFVVPEFYQIGDCLSPRNMLEANQAGYHTARDIGRY